MAAVIHTNNAPAAVGPYSQAMDCGEFVFCSGQIPLVPETGLLVEGGIEEQARQMFLQSRGQDFPQRRSQKTAHKHGSTVCQNSDWHWFLLSKNSALPDALQAVLEGRIVYPCLCAQQRHGHIVHIGAGGAGDQQSVHLFQRVVGVVLFQHLEHIQPGGL